MKLTKVEEAFPVTSTEDAEDKPLMVRDDMWELAGAVALIRRLQPKAHEYGFNLTLGGGVLNNGYSPKDLDVVAVPRTIRTATEKTRDALVKVFGGDPLRFSQMPGRRVYGCKLAGQPLPVDLIFIDVAFEALEPALAGNQGEDDDLPW
jgi:hypothetical protein